MPLAEGISALVVYKFYASGAISANSEPLIASEPGASGGQRLRRVGCTLDLTKQTFESEEFRSDRQVVDYRHGSRSVTGEISGELSPGTYRDFFQALMRGTWVLPPSAITQAQATSVIPDTGGTLTFGSGDLNALGVRVGSVVRFTSGLAAGNLNVYYLVTGMSGTTGRVFNVSPAPATTQTAQTTFSMTVVGGRLTPPASSPVSRKLAVEVNHEDLDISRLFTELRINSCNMSIPPNGMGTVSFGMTGRNMQLLSGAAAPYFTSPTAETTTGVLAGANGAVIVGGSAIGIVTSFDCSVDLAAEAEPVIGQNFVPEIFLGRLRVSGSMTLYFDTVTQMKSL